MAVCICSGRETQDRTENLTTSLRGVFPNARAPTQTVVSEGACSPEQDLVCTDRREQLVVPLASLSDAHPLSCCLLISFNTVDLEAVSDATRQTCRPQDGCLSRWQPQLQAVTRSDQLVVIQSRATSSLASVYFLEQLRGLPND